MSSDKGASNFPQGPPGSGGPNLPALKTAMGTAFAVERAVAEAKGSGTNLRAYMADPDTPFEAMHEQYQRILVLVNEGYSDAEIARQLRCSPGHCWQVRNSPAGRAVLRKAGRQAEELMAETRWNLAVAARDASRLIHEVVVRGDALGFSPAQRLEAAKYAIDFADPRPESQPPRTQPEVAMGIYTDERRLRVVMEGPPPDLFSGAKGGTGTTA